MITFYKYIFHYVVRDFILKLILASVPVLVHTHAHSILTANFMFTRVNQCFYNYSQGNIWRLLQHYFYKLNKLTFLMLNQWCQSTDFEFGSLVRD